MSHRRVAQLRLLVQPQAHGGRLERRGAPLVVIIILNIALIVLIVTMIVILVIVIIVMKVIVIVIIVIVLVIVIVIVIVLVIVIVTVTVIVRVPLSGRCHTNFSITPMRNPGGYACIIKVDTHND